MARHLAPKIFHLLSACLPKHILLIEDDLSDAENLTTVVTAMDQEINLAHTTNLVDTLQRLDEQQFDAILVSVNSEAFSTIRRLLDHSDAPVIVLTTLANDSLGTHALQIGADDYAVKQTLTAESLRQVLQRATARNIWRRQMYAMSIVDELTGLYNRRGFMTLGEQQLKIARRTGTGVNLAFADVDAFKYINDHFGHSEGDRVLKDTARILKTTFCRDTDLIARIGGDEFAVLWIPKTSSSSEVVRKRFNAALDTHMATEKPPYALSVSMGLCQYHSDFSNPLTEMLSEGDQRMYMEKCRSKSNIA